MTARRVLIVEDDRFAKESIPDALILEGRRRLIEIKCEIDTSEGAALQRLARLSSNEAFDAYVVDLLLPWYQGRPVPDVADPRVLEEDGELRAGMRVIEYIWANQQRLLSRPDAPRVPVFLYTVAANRKVLEFPPGTAGRITYLTKGSDDEQLAKAVLDHIADKTER